MIATARSVNSLTTGSGLGFGFPPWKPKPRPDPGCPSSTGPRGGGRLPEHGLGQELSGRVGGDVGALDVEGVPAELLLPGAESDPRLDQALQHADVVRGPDVRR